MKDYPFYYAPSLTAAKALWRPPFHRLTVIPPPKKKVEEDPLLSILSLSRLRS